MKRNKSAFTMIELIFVIVIMGVIGKFGVEFLANAYESFIFSKINNTLQERSSSTVEFISKRLESRIKDSVIIRSGALKDTLNGSTLTDAQHDNATVLEWISTDTEGFRGNVTPFWTGVIDLNTTTSSTTNLVSPGSDFASTHTLMNTLSGNALTGAAIYFISSSLTTHPWGYDGNISNMTLLPIKLGTSNNSLASNGSNFSGIEIYEYYKLVSTANAISLEDYNNTTNIGDLYFYYNYRPWLGEVYTDGNKTLLSENINTFRFKGVGSLIKIQVCAKSDLTTKEYALCKEKTIY